MSYCTAPTEVKARKPHRCTWCGEEIAPSTNYWRWYSVNEDGCGSTSKMHDECFDAVKQDDEREYFPFENERPRVGA